MELVSMALYKMESPETPAAPTRPPGSPLAALVSGAAVSAVGDETLTPPLGFSAPNRAYPAVTHISGVAAHLVFGAAVGAVSEAAWALTGRRPGARSTATVRL